MPDPSVIIYIGSCGSGNVEKRKQSVLRSRQFGSKSKQVKLNQWSRFLPLQTFATDLLAITATTMGRFLLLSSAFSVSSAGIIQLKMALESSLDRSTLPGALISLSWNDQFIMKLNFMQNGWKEYCEYNSELANALHLQKVF